MVCPRALDMQAGHSGGDDAMANSRADEDVRQITVINVGMGVGFDSHICVADIMGY